MTFDCPASFSFKQYLVHTCTVIRICTMFLLHVASISLCLGGSLAISLPPANPAINAAANGSVPALDGTSVQAISPVCDSSFYGFDLNRASCQEAVDLMDTEYWAKTYVMRNVPGRGGQMAQALPNRWLSCKAYFIIKPSHI